MESVHCDVLKSLTILMEWINIIMIIGMNKMIINIGVKPIEI